MYKGTPQTGMIAIGLLLLVGFLVNSCQTKVESKPWEGRWTLSKVISPEGDELVFSGLYHYYSDGKFTSQLVGPDRAALESDPVTLEELTAAVADYRAGFGTYSVDEQAGILAYSYETNLRTHRQKDEPTPVPFEITPDGMVFTYDDGWRLFLVR